jgi:hypothetical protein
LSETEQPIADEIYTLTLHNPRDKYYVERATAVLLVLFSLVIGAACFIIFGSIARSASTASSGSELILLLLVASCVLIPIILAIRTWLAAQLEDKLVASDNDPSFLITADGVSGSIVMLEGPQRSRLRKSGLARFSLSWDEICEVRFVRLLHSPAQMRIVPSSGEQKCATYWVLRANFVGHEQHMVELLNAHGVNVLVQDQLH